MYVCKCCVKKKIFLVCKDCHEVIVSRWWLFVSMSCPNYHELPASTYRHWLFVSMSCPNYHELPAWAARIIMSCPHWLFISMSCPNYHELPAWAARIIMSCPQRRIGIDCCVSMSCPNQTWAARINSWMSKSIQCWIVDRLDWYIRLYLLHFLQQAGYKTTDPNFELFD